MKLLFAASEAYPLIKTGGLGDVANSLPNSLFALGPDVRLALPAYREVLAEVASMRVLGWLQVTHHQSVRIVEAQHSGFRMPIWLIDAPHQFDRGGNPYTHPDGYEWPDNAERFSIYCRAVAMLATDALGLGWRADVVHCNDWQTGLIPAFLSLDDNPPRTVFTIHNIAYDCQFEFPVFQHLHLPSHWWSVEGGEFYGRFSMLKAGLTFSDVINTVSPRYAQEICTPEFGYGYAAILAANRHKLSGIINGIDNDVWNPREDPHLVAQYGTKAALNGAKKPNRIALLERLDVDAEVIAQDLPLLGFVGRLVFQKGIDLLLDAIPQVLAERAAQFVLIGSGQVDLEWRLRQLSGQFPDQVFNYIGYSEPLAHLLEAGSDLFVMPSRYEPCGLNQLYSLQYGTPPIVRNTGGLADTVCDANSANMAAGTATGFVFEHAAVEELVAAIHRGLDLHADSNAWQRLIRTGMKQDVCWERSAREYLDLYRYQT